MAECVRAHDFALKLRTQDVHIQEKVDFSSLLLSENVLEGLKKAGFQKPSPIQLKAIPLGRCGLDLVVQAKSGTGKTCVFAVIALESIILDTSNPQVLVVAPTREIAVQIWEVINTIGLAMPKLRCYTFIGGLPLAEDKAKLKKCHIVVGTPGRLKQLIEHQALNTESIRLFVLDEADKLMEQGFQDTINWIYSSLAENKQMLALSATYPEVLAQHLTVYMRNPMIVRLNVSDPSLIGIRQFYKLVTFSPIQQKAFEFKCKALLNLLHGVSFQQCLVFSNYQLRAQSLSDILNREGWPATHISGSQDQQDRLVAMAKLKTFKCRVLISTDLTSRGIDAENVNLVVNLDIPYDHETYLHRIGRAGRFGMYGAAVTFVSLGKEMAELKVIEQKANTKICQLPDDIPTDLAHSSGFVDYAVQVSSDLQEIEYKESPSSAEKESHYGGVDDDEDNNEDDHGGHDDNDNESTQEKVHYHEFNENNGNVAKYIMHRAELNHDQSSQQIFEDSIANGLENVELTNDCRSDDILSNEAEFVHDHLEPNRNFLHEVDAMIENFHVKLQSDYKRIETILEFNENDNEQMNDLSNGMALVSDLKVQIEDEDSPLPSIQALRLFSAQLKLDESDLRCFSLPRSSSNPLGEYLNYNELLEEYKGFLKTGQTSLEPMVQLNVHENHNYKITTNKLKSMLEKLYEKQPEQHSGCFGMTKGCIITIIDDVSNPERTDVYPPSPLLSESSNRVVLEEHAQALNDRMIISELKKQSKFTESSSNEEMVIGFIELDLAKAKAIKTNSIRRKKLLPKFRNYNFNKNPDNVRVQNHEDEILGLSYMKRLSSKQESSTLSLDGESSDSTFQEELEYSDGYYEHDGDQYDGHCGNKNYRNYKKFDGEATTGYEEYYPQQYGWIPHNGAWDSSTYEQLWMQCAQLLGSINAMQAAQYSVLCHQWYWYHVQYAAWYRALSLRPNTRKSDKGNKSTGSRQHKSQNQKNI